MGYNTNRLKERAMEFEEQYDEEMIEDLIEKIKESLDGQEASGIYSTELEELITEWRDSLPDINEWCWDKVNSELDEIGDQQRDLERDMQWEKERDEEKTR